MHEMYGMMMTCSTVHGHNNNDNLVFAFKQLPLCTKFTYMYNRASKLPKKGYILILWDNINSNVLSHVERSSSPQRFSINGNYNMEANILGPKAVLKTNLAGLSPKERLFSSIGGSQYMETI